MVTAKLICVFVFAYAKNRFSHGEAHIDMPFQDLLAINHSLCLYSSELQLKFLCRKDINFKTEVFLMEKKAAISLQLLPNYMCLVQVTFSTCAVLKCMLSTIMFLFYSELHIPSFHVLKDSTFSKGPQPYPQFSTSFISPVQQPFPHTTHLPVYTNCFSVPVQPKFPMPNLFNSIFQLTCHTVYQVTWLLERLFLLIFLRQHFYC